MTIYEILAYRLDDIRQARGLSITAFSELLDISRSSMHLILRAKANPRLDTIEQIAQKLGMDLVALLIPPDAHQTFVSPVLTREKLMELLREMLGETYERADL